MSNGVCDICGDTHGVKWHEKTKKYLCVLCRYFSN